ncbi:MAG TPA: alpha-2-macroglobulin family protein, partial [Candidatus Limnocylindria bacterium]|nr:alpha-2-macroglobulin family protein [Candidatus Limnocylindria bacterium]
TGADGTATVTYKPTKAGTLRLVAIATDRTGRTSRSATYLWVSGAGFALWQVTNDDTIKLVADKERYEVGDTAEILVPAPFAGATALVTVERGKIITREVRTLPTNSERLRIPIVDHSVPDVFVSVVLYRGPTAEDPLPRYKVGYTQLPVDTSIRKLNVKITPDRAQAQPGETVRYAIAVTDRNGRGVRSQLSVAVVDKAVLSLMEERGPDGMRAFWFERGLAVNTNSSMGVSVDRWNDVIAELPRVGKGGSGSGLTGDRERQDYRNTAYWESQLVTKDDGTATVDVVMPDDLTTWRLQARAISGDTMVGEGTNELVSTKPLLIRSALPRFLRTGDEVDLRVLVRNGTGAARRVPVTLKAEGPIAVSGALTQTQDLSSDGRSFAYVWRAKVQGEGTVTVSVSGAAGKDSDAMKVSLPAYIDLTPETMSTGGVVTKEAGLEAIYLPKFADTAHGTLGVGVRSSLVGSLASELPSFDRRPPFSYPEDTMSVASRVIATMAVARADAAAGTGKSYDSRITTDLAELIGRQRPDGGWPWCIAPECGTDPNVTGWVLLALGEAHREQRSVDPAVVGRASSYVYAWLNRPNSTVNPTTSDQDQRAYMLAALAAAGSTSAWNNANALFEQYRTQLANWGRAYLIGALVDSGGKTEDTQPRALLNDLAASTIPSANGNHWEDPATAAKSSFMTSTATTALVALAIARVQPEHQLLAQTVRWLTVARGGQGWQTSVERAMSILALATYVQLTGEQGTEFGYRVALDEKMVLTGTVRKSTTPTEDSTRIPLTRVTPGKASVISVEREFAKTGRLYYTLDLRYMTPAKDIEAVNRGFGLSHTYTLLDDPSRPVTSAKLGEVVRVTLTVLAPSDRSYVTIEDLLPAGLEAIDARLRTTDPSLKKKLEDERVAAFQRG